MIKVQVVFLWVSFTLLVKAIPTPWDIRQVTPTTGTRNNDTTSDEPSATSFQTNIRKLVSSLGNWKKIQKDEANPPVENLPSYQVDAKTGMMLSQSNDDFRTLLSEKSLGFVLIESLKPLNEEEWCSYWKSGHFVGDLKKLQLRVFNGGVDPNLRKQVWPIILKFFVPNLNPKSRAFLLQNKKEEYMGEKQIWQKGMPFQTPVEADLSHQLAIDVARTFQNEEFFHPTKVEPESLPTDLHSLSASEALQSTFNILMTFHLRQNAVPYIQGMNYFAALFYYVFQDEALSYWAYKKFLERMATLFEKGFGKVMKQQPKLAQLLRVIDPDMHSHLKQFTDDEDMFFFSFQWILLSFSKEFPINDVARIWEAVLVNPMSLHYDHFITLAILQLSRGYILQNVYSKGELQQFGTQFLQAKLGESKITAMDVLCSANHIFEKFIDALENYFSFNATKDDPETRQQYHDLRTFYFNRDYESCDLED